MSKNKVLRLTESLYSKPHLISQAGFNAISHYLNARNNIGLMALDEPVEEPEDDPDDLDDFDPESGVGVINIEGALTYKPVYGMCGAVGCSYEQILDQTEQMIEAGAKIIVFNCDSGGGEGYAAFETGDELRRMCDEAGVYSIAYNDGCMASACYALAVQCDEVISNPSAQTGSIGVLIALVNDSKHLEQEGYTRSFISAGDSKIPFAEDGTWKESFLEDLQNKVDIMYEEFVQYVAKYSGLSDAAIRDTQAKCFMANEALNIGLINKIMTRSDFVSYLTDLQKGKA